MNLTKLQLELLKMYQIDLSDQQLVAVKDLVSKYFANSATDELDQKQEEKGWSNETVDSWLEGAQ